MSTARLDPDPPSCQKQDGCQPPSTVHKTRGTQTHTLNCTHVGLDFLRRGNGRPISSMKIYPSSEWCWTFKTRAAIRAHWLSHLALISGRRQVFWVRGFGMEGGASVLTWFNYSHHCEGTAPQGKREKETHHCPYTTLRGSQIISIKSADFITLAKKEKKKNPIIGSLISHLHQKDDIYILIVSDW